MKYFIAFMLSSILFGLGCEAKQPVFIAIGAVCCAIVVGLVMLTSKPKSYENPA